MTAELFHRYPFLRTADIDEAQTRLSAEMERHALTFLGPERTFDTVINRLVLGDIQLFYIRYGAHVLIEPEPLTDYLVITPVEGQCRFWVDGDDAWGTVDQAAIVAPGQALRIDWQPDCAVINVSIPRETMETLAARVTRLSVRDRIVFDPYLSLTAGPGRSWRNLMDFVQQELADEKSVLSAGVQTRLIEEMICSTLLTGQPNTLSEFFGEGRRRPVPYYVKRVEDYLRQNLSRDVSVDELAEVARVSVRTIYDGFRKYRGIGPMKAAKGMRLDRARDDLLAADDDRDTVKDVAARWGFHHGSSFATDFAERFGELPSETLRRRARPFRPGAGPSAPELVPEPSPPPGEKP